MSDGLSKSCCSPSLGRTQAKPLNQSDLISDQDLSKTAISIPAGPALLGTATGFIHDDGETPMRRKKIKAFRINPTTVTNAEFQAFVSATGYLTEAEEIGWSFVFWEQVPKEVGATQAVEAVQWWRRVEGANWRDVNGPNTSQDHCHDDHPVVQVSWRDAMAYARWAGGRLPTELEWEHAARGGLQDVRFPWGDDEPNDIDAFPCNIWQGNFPKQNSCLDGFYTTAPAQSYAPNGYGLYNTVGNVWEWTGDKFTIKSLKKAAKIKIAGMKGFRLLKGGSFLCHRSYCYRYRIAARSGNSPDSATTHQGFRMVWDV